MVIDDALEALRGRAAGCSVVDADHGVVSLLSRGQVKTVEIGAGIGTGETDVDLLAGDVPATRHRGEVHR